MAASFTRGIIAFFVFVFVAYVNTTQHTINVTINGSDNFATCYQTNCTLTAAFRILMQNRKFKQSTEIRLAPGNYKLNESFSFTNVGDIIIGAADTGGREPERAIQCEGNNSGFSFRNSRNISIHGISLVSCGSVYNSSSYNRPLFYSALFVENCDNFKISYAKVKNSIGIGLTIYNGAGNITINKVIFEKNGPNTTYCENQPTNSTKYFARAGGGVVIEFTYDEKNFVSNSTYHILNSRFTGNVSPFPNLINITFDQPETTKYMGFSRGGGLAVYFRGFAQQNNFMIDSCLFENNIAVWGGGYFVQFLDNVQGNEVIITNTNITGNEACFGGGAFEVSSISSRDQNISLLTPNIIHSVRCLFLNNSAVSGGGGTVFARSRLGYDNYCFHQCTWDSNKAEIGFAISLKLWDFDQGLFGPNIPFKVNLTDCNITRNTIRASDINSVQSGLGAVYDFLVPLLLTNVHFIENTNTSLVIDTSSVTIVGNVIFSKNTGLKGGAVAMYGEACFNLTKHSKLTFISNIAYERGGAIYVESPGPDDIPNNANNYILSHECFFKYEDRYLHPNNWQAEVYFIGNEAPNATGYSVFSNTLQYCISTSDTNFNNVLQWDSFHYLRSSSSNSSTTRGYEVTTDAIKIHYNESQWRVPSEQAFSPQVVLVDEKNNSVYGIVQISIQSPKSSPVTLGTPSPLFLVRDNISFLELKGNTGAHFSVQIRTVGGQVAEANLVNLSLVECNPGFIQKGKDCVCLSDYGFAGVSRCSDDGLHVYLEKGYWAGEIKGQNGQNRFVTAQCPTGYCDCVHPDTANLNTAECLYDTSKICSGNRVGVLCGSCKNGHDVVLGDQDCSPDCKNSDLWKLAPLLFSLTILVFFIFIINIDIFTCYMNAWLYFYQVVNVVTGVQAEVSFDPFVTFIIGLANITLSGFGSCMWQGMDNLSKLGFSYLLPVYVFMVILIITLIAQRHPNTYFSKNSSFRASCTLFVLCYCTLTRVSMEILRPSKVGDTIVVFSQGTVQYFSSYHSYFAVPAILILVFIVIPFPIVLMFTPFFSRRFKCIAYATPLFNIFQSCFKDSYRWFAAFYFFCRFTFLLFATFIPYGEVKAIIIQVACALVLSIHVYLCPYLPEYNWINTLDSLLLAILTVISIIAGQITGYVSASRKTKMMISIDILAYIPLIYAVGLCIYLIYTWVKRRFFLTEPGFCNLKKSEQRVV